MTVGQIRARSAEAKAGRRLQILDCAAALCAQSGYDELAVSDVAARAGLAKGTIFRYFPTKEDLGRALAEAHLARWSDDLDRRLARIPGPPAPDAAARMRAHYVQDYGSYLQMLTPLISQLTLLMPIGTAQHRQPARADAQLAVAAGVILAVGLSLGSGTDCQLPRA